MSAIADANAYPPDIVALCDGLDGFLKQEVIATPRCSTMNAAFTPTRGAITPTRWR